jgi:formate-dependent nitrite reductase membrane component NrfD
VANVFGAPALVRSALWIAFAGALISPPLLIADLGRPIRFLYMLRVFKLRSAMSVGVWTLIAFSGGVTAALLCRELMLAGYTATPVRVVEWLGLIVAALFGMVLASYTSVLLSVTAIPVWSENRSRLPIVFLGGALGSAGAALELVGFLDPATQIIGIIASTVEMVMAIATEFRDRRVDRPLREGASGRLLRAAAILAGPIPLLLRTIMGHSLGARYAAAMCFLAGAVITRYGWIAAGRASSRDPHALFDIQRSHQSPTA